MTDSDFRKSIASGLHGAYIFFGEEDFLKKRYMEEARKNICGDDGINSLNFVRLSPESGDWSEAESAALSLPLMSDRKLVVMQVDFEGLKPSQLTSLIKFLDELGDAPQTVLIIMTFAGQFNYGYSMKKPSDLYKKISLHAQMVYFQYQDEGKLINWLGRHIASYGLKSSVEVCSELINRCGSNMTVLDNEVSKLSSYALFNGFTEVTPQIVDRICSESEQLEAFGLSNAILQGDTSKALKELNKYRNSGENEMVVLSQITSNLSDMLKVKIYTADRTDARDIARKIHIAEYKVRLCQNATRNISKETLAERLDRCCDTEVKIKTSSVGYTAIERLICSMG